MEEAQTGRIRAGGQKPGFSSKYFVTTPRATKKPGFFGRSIKRGQKPGFSRKDGLRTLDQLKNPVSLVVAHNSWTID